MTIENILIIIFALLGGILLALSELFSQEIVSNIRTGAKTTIAFVSTIIFRFVLAYWIIYTFYFSAGLNYLGENDLIVVLESNPQIMLRFLMIGLFLALVPHMFNSNFINHIQKQYASIRAQYISGWLGIAFVGLATYLGIR